jgi:hypothetical protein
MEGGQNLVDESFGTEKKRARTGWNQNQNSHRKWRFQIQNEKIKNNPNSEFFNGNPTWFLHRGGLRPPSLFLISTRI